MGQSIFSSSVEESTANMRPFIALPLWVWLLTLVPIWVWLVMLLALWPHRALDLLLLDMVWLLVLLPPWPRPLILPLLPLPHTPLFTRDPEPPLFTNLPQLSPSRSTLDRPTMSLATPPGS